MNAAGTEGFWSDTGYGVAAGSTPYVDSASLAWDYESGYVEAGVRVGAYDEGGPVQMSIARDGVSIGTFAADESYFDRTAQPGRTYTYTFTATQAGNTSEPYSMRIYTNPEDYESGESAMVELEVKPAPTQSDPGAVSVVIGNTDPHSTYEVVRDDELIAEVGGTSGDVELIDHPGTGAHDYQVNENSSDGTSALAPSQTKAVEIVADDVQPGIVTRPMFRLYNPNSGEHFYTADSAERDSLDSIGWNYEGISWMAPVLSAVAVYRLYNPNGGDHHYTMDPEERDGLAAIGWNDEGIGWYSDVARTVPLYREYNPNEFSCNHNYTTDRGEHEFLVTLGWHDEGTAWYGA